MDRWKDLEHRLWSYSTVFSGPVPVHSKLNFVYNEVQFKFDYGFIFTFPLCCNSEQEAKSQDSVIPLSQNDSMTLRIDDPLGLGD